SSDDLSFDLRLNATNSNPALPPASPSALTASAASSTSITLRWIDTSTTEAGFKIDRSIDGTNFAQITTVPVNSTTYTDLGLSPGRQYWYRIRAYNLAGDSTYSGSALATTP